MVYRKYMTGGHDVPKWRRESSVILFQVGRVKACATGRRENIFKVRQVVADRSYKFILVSLQVSR